MKKYSLMMLAMFMSSRAFAEAEEVVNQMVTTSGGISDKAIIALAMTFGLGLAAFGGTTAQGRVGAAAMEGIARNPQAQPNMFISMILSLVFIESLVIFTLLIAFLLLGTVTG